MTDLDFKDLELFDVNLHRLLSSITTARVLAESLTYRKTEHKRKYPNMNDAKIDRLFFSELEEYKKTIRADYDSMLMRAVTCGITFPYSIGEILDYIENSIK